MIKYHRFYDKIWKIEDKHGFRSKGNIGANSKNLINKRTNKLEEISNKQKHRTIVWMSKYKTKVCK